MRWQSVVRVNFSSVCLSCGLVGILLLSGETVGCESRPVNKGVVPCDPGDPSTCPEDMTCSFSMEVGAYQCVAIVHDCGNGQVETLEACDGDALGGHSCVALGFDFGVLACTAVCSFDTSGCVAPANCNNGLLDPGEECDGANLGGQTCEGLDMGGGTLGCSSACRYDANGCDTPPVCGNNRVDLAEACDDGNTVSCDGCSSTCQVDGCGNAITDCGEACDDGNSVDGDGCAANCQSDETCGNAIVDTSVGEVCDDGNNVNTDGCRADCSVEQGWACVGQPSVCAELCGNGSLDTGEQCDGGQLGTGTCQILGYDTGSLACATDCTYDTGGCSLFSCGDGVVTGGEDCEIGDLNGATCQSLGFISGSLTCTTNCGFDTTACVPPECGDGIITASIGEQCDDNDIDSGDGCDAACQVENGYICANEPSVCSLSCGNDTWDPGEECDGGDLHGGTCLTQGFPGGILACSPTCTYNTSTCLDAVCPNAIREGSEECDGSDFGGQDCTNFGFTGGSLSCTGACTIDTSGCANAVCGNSVVEAGEQCDDGDTTGGDGCSATCQWESTCTADETIICGGSDYISNSSVVGNDADNYSCSSLGSSSDRIYALTIPAGISSVTAALTCDDSEDDYDLFILEEFCHGALCLDYSATSSCDNLTFDVTPGLTYYIVVEEYDSAWGGVTLDVSCN